MDQAFKRLKRAEIKPENRSLGIVRHNLIDEKGPHGFPQFARLEIATYGSDSGFFLFHLCADGSGTDTWHQTLDDAFHQAEFEFKVSRDEWHDCE
jgi:hypothetical protein